jgi:hypothetical protein
MSSRTEYSNVFPNVFYELNNSAVSIGNFESIIKPKVNDNKFDEWGMGCDIKICKEFSKIIFSSFLSQITILLTMVKMVFLFVKETLESYGIKIIGKRRKHTK